MSEPFSIFSKYIPANPDMKQAPNAALNPINLDCSGAFEATTGAGAEESWTKATPAASRPKANHCQFFNTLPNTNTAKKAVVNIFN